jgi:hypothetical protein
VVRAGGQHVDGRLDSELPGRHGRHRHPGRGVRGSVQRAAIARDPRPQVAVAHDAKTRRTIVGDAQQDHGDLRPVELACDLAQRLVGLAEDGGAHDRRYGGGAHVQQAMHRVTCARQPRAHRRRDVMGASVGAERAHRRLGSQ